MRLEPWLRGCLRAPRLSWLSRPPALSSAGTPRATGSSSASGVGGCWSCGQAFPGGSSSSGGSPRFCPSCHALQPPETPEDLFRLLGCERSFRLDVARLQQQFRDLQRQLHPDFFSRRPQVERDFSEQHSSLVNKAYQTLLSPLSRGLYLLELHGLELEQGTDPQADPDFLSEVMEVSEKLSEANSEGKIEEVENFIAAKQEELVQSISKAFDAGERLPLSRLALYSSERGRLGDGVEEGQPTLKALQSSLGAAESLHDPWACWKLKGLQLMLAHLLRRPPPSQTGVPFCLLDPFPPPTGVPSSFYRPRESSFSLSPPCWLLNLHALPCLAWGYPPERT
ncbi:hypothetical protein JRQ81_007949 [Phrynocephalus forsythii]|uniref:J domain-containing protein n=1 Tax=Phrynocephalus forsythii TaxID=171643 RepID=A0A9Q1ATW2_9SAUR|nr:hypothetical protein JRQ81_007949 [Phrynocephalus forsythii]